MKVECLLARDETLRHRNGKADSRLEQFLENRIRNRRREAFRNLELEATVQRDQSAIKCCVMECVQAKTVVRIKSASLIL